ncbi:RNA polymerase sigma-70 factor, ECF subfamily [Amycolatopsis arida]|uniref:RNA polymerase sigma-70 factor, ECF subfamily n=1 Tax=Amycolatopsis arida TaxID=587909 RepID=A0A1I5T7S7_9PSEU|nr:sigma factor [Amycolatopsis arida]TDX96203.1 sigma-70-like protein [Amycolatopsis arida]SFP78871.1 RNA polymerase sigma-70 factor, ECF subfamily [Amycolatopsis arida]
MTTSVRVDGVTLVSSARDGDVRAYERLVLRYQGPIYRLGLRMLGNRGDAEDVTQYVFLTAWSVSARPGRASPRSNSPSR